MTNMEWRESRIEEFVRRLEEFIEAHTTDMNSQHIEDAVRYSGIRKDFIKYLIEDTDIMR